MWILLKITEQLSKYVIKKGTFYNAEAMHIQSRLKYDPALSQRKYLFHSNTSNRGPWIENKQMDSLCGKIIAHRR